MGIDVPDLGEASQSTGAITFALSTRLTISGSLVIVLGLFRNGALTRTSTLMVCERHGLSGALQTCRQHLRKLGIGEETQERPPTVVPEPRRAMSPDRRKRPVRLPLAATL